MISCDFCDGNKAVYYKDNENCVFINSKGILDMYVRGKRQMIRVEYCPKCGKSFNKSEE